MSRESGAFPCHLGGESWLCHIRCQREGGESCSKSASDVRWSGVDNNNNKGERVMFYVHIRCLRGMERESCSMSTSDVQEEWGESHVLYPHQMSERKGERVMF